MSADGLAFAEKALTFPCGACQNCMWNERRREDIARAFANGIGGEALGGDKDCRREVEFLAQEARRLRRVQG